MFPLYLKRRSLVCAMLLTCVTPSFASAQTARTAADPDLAQAYQAASQNDYDSAAMLFRKALLKDPANTSAHKDFAYTLLKAGESAEARDQFEAALKINPHDESAALEFAFLAFETQEPVEARRMFDRLRKSGTAATRATAEKAFQNIDIPLAEGIARWQQALAASPNPNNASMFSAHWELARLAEERDNLPLAAEQYALCRKLKPQLSEILLIQARIWQQLNRVEEARAAILAASRQQNPRTAEEGLEQWGTRYPYPYEFVQALALDPQNVPLRRELAYLYLAMQKPAEATAQFEKVLAIDPTDSLSRDQLDALHGVKKAPAVPPAVTGASPAVGPKQMGVKSLALGFARDAIKYLRQAHDEDPDDAEVMLKLGWAYNYAKDDADAIPWFDRARQSDDPAIAKEANKAFHNLNGDTPAQTTIWALPMYSSRWNDMFSYGQIKRTIPLPSKDMNKWFSIYLSARFAGDLTSNLPARGRGPRDMWDNVAVLGLGASSKTWHHLTGWAEGGEGIRALPYRHDIAAAVPDYRGGLNFAKGFGHLLGSQAPGPFFETTADAIYISRYDKDWIFQSENRAGWTFHPFGSVSAQVLLNANYVHDLKNQYWAETTGFGPGFRMHLPWMPKGGYFFTDFIRGAYTNNVDNPRRPNYNDIRVGVWYAITK